MENKPVQNQPVVATPTLPAETPTSVAESTSSKISLENTTSPKAVSTITIPRLSDKKDQAKNPFNNMYTYIFNNNVRRTYTLLTMTFGFISILLLFAILPTIQSISEISKKIEDDKALIAQQTDKLANLNVLELETENTLSNGGLSEYVSYLNDVYIPDKLLEENVYKDLLDRMKISNVNIDSIKTADFKKVQGDVTSGFTFTNAYQLSIHSDKVESINSFLKSIAASKNLYTLQRADILSPVSKITGTSVSNYICTIDFLAYFYE